MAAETTLIRLRTMKNEFPVGWDEDEIRKIAEYYDREASGEIVIRPPLKKGNDLWFVEVPKAPLPKIRRLLAEFEAASDGL